MKTTLLSVTIQNFMSIGNVPVTIDLNNGLINMIVGINNDVGDVGQSSNGAGKTTIFQAVMYCLFDEGLNNIRKDNFINMKNKKGMLVTLRLEIDGRTYEITRGRKPNKIEILKDGNPFTLHSVKNNDEAILELLGYDAVIFTNAYMLTSNSTPFLAMKGAEQKSFMETLIRLHILTRRADSLKMHMKENAVDIKLETQNKEHHQADQQKTKNNLDQLIRRQTERLDDINTRIADITKRIADISKIDFDSIILQWSQNDTVNTELNKLKTLHNDVTNEIRQLDHDHRTEVTAKTTSIDTELNSSISEITKQRHDAIQIMGEERSLDEREIHKLTTEATELSHKIDKMSTEITVHTNEIERYKKELTSLDDGTCPYCEQAYTSETHITEINTNIENHSVAIGKLSSDIEPLLDQEDSLKSSIDEKKSSIGDIYRAKEKAITEKYDAMIDETKMMSEKKKNTLLATLDEAHDVVMQDVMLRKVELESAMQECTDKLYVPELTRDKCFELQSSQDALQAELTLLETESKNDPFDEQIKVLSAGVSEYDYEVLNDLDSKDKHFKMLIKLLTDNKSFVRKNLLDQYIPFINDRITQNLVKVDSAHLVTIQNDLSVDITYWFDNVSYGNLSNGERLRVNLAVSLAFRDFVNATINNLNVMFFDEIFDNGADTTFFHKAFKLMKDMECTVFLISHRDELIPDVDKIIRIEKTNGFSEIK